MWLNWIFLTLSRCISDPPFSYFQAKVSQIVKLFSQAYIEARGVRGQIVKCCLYQSPTCNRVTTSLESQNIPSFVMKIWHVKVKGITYSYAKYRDRKWPKMTIFDPYFKKYVTVNLQMSLRVILHQALHTSVSSKCRSGNIWNFRNKDG